MCKLCFIDVETTGTDPQIHGIVQMAGMIDIDGQTVETFNLKTQPFTDDIVEPKALEVNGLTLDQINVFPKPFTVHKELIHLLGNHVDQYDKSDKLTFCGYNCQGFDSPFVRQWLYKNGNKYYGSYFWSNTIDIMTMWSYLLKNERHTMKNFKLMTVAEKAGIEIDPNKAHDALYDIEITRQLYYLADQKIKNIAK